MDHTSGYVTGSVHDTQEAFGAPEGGPSRSAVEKRRDLVPGTSSDHTFRQVTGFNIDLKNMSTSQPNS